MKFHFENQIFK